MAKATTKSSKTNKSTKGTKDMYRYKLLIDSIEKYETGQLCDISFNFCTDTIIWLWKFRKISEEEMKNLCNRMTNVMQMWQGTNKYKLYG